MSDKPQPNQPAPKPAAPRAAAPRTGAQPAAAQPAAAKPLAPKPVAAKAPAAAPKPAAASPATKPVAAAPKPVAAKAPAAAAPKAAASQAVAPAAQAATSQAAAAKKPQTFAKLETEKAPAAAAVTPSKGAATAPVAADNKSKAATAKATNDTVAAEGEEAVEPARRSGFMSTLSSTGASLVFHVALLLLMANMADPAPPSDKVGEQEVVMEKPVDPPKKEELITENEKPEEEPVTPPPMPPANASLTDQRSFSVGPATTSDPNAVDSALSDNVVEGVVDFGPGTDRSAGSLKVDIPDAGGVPGGIPTLVNKTGKSLIGTPTGTGLSGRGGANKARLIRDSGGTQGSEAAVAAALKWISAHQMSDGGWSFDHTKAGDGCACPNPGTQATSRNGATAMALLPFLGAGQTHKEGTPTYKRQVEAGLRYMLLKIKPNGSLHETGGTMYSHGLATITLTEAYGMTHDPALRAPAQAAVDFIGFAQDPAGGGWRYEPRQAGDTSVVGWQIMALKSAHLAYLRVDKNVTNGATKFLDSVGYAPAVGDDNGGGFSRYGYTGPNGGSSATTAIALLCRMHLGWKHDNAGLIKGIEYIQKTGLSPHDMYYNYYATQVCRHFDGDVWKKWNTVMRDPLIAMQEKAGHATGSWFMSGSHNGPGGRLYCTALGAMMLEVYYRHMPIYAGKAVEEEFPLN